MATNNENLEYRLPTDAYANFDALTLKSFIIDRLNENSTFRDQNFEGSNLSSIIDIIAYSYHVLLFYLNQTASESMFSNSTIYENINRIVNLMGYKPIGKQTSICPIDCVADSELPIGSYFLKKYSYFLVDNVQYTINEDFFFDKTTDSEENITTINENLLLYQGTVGEYPVYVASGEDFETFPIVVENLTSNTTKFISHGSVSVYVKESDTGVWYEYEEVDNLFLVSTNNRVYDLRLNENGHYEVKFGNDVFGRKIKESDEVAVYYILSDGDSGAISEGAINGNKLFVLNTSRFSQIYSDVSSAGSSSSQIDRNNNSLLTFSNSTNSTAVSEAETVDQIKTNAPILVNSQLRLVTETDYETFLRKNAPNLLNSVKVVSNKRYIEEYIQYFYDLCVDPNKVNRVIVNQVNFADSCDFNDINIFLVPPFSITKDGQYPTFLSNSFKNYIKDLVGDKKMINYEIVPRDPVYVAFDLGFARNSLPESSPIYNTTKLQVIRNNNVKISKELIKNQIIAKINTFFAPSNNELGGLLDISSLGNDIISINGVSTIKMVNSDNTQYNGISFVARNPVYEKDVEIITQSTALPFFKFPYLYNPESIVKRIDIVDE